ncbi:MAG: BamA/TamA family outer membrane protein [Longimicrobiales bacterium]
MKRSAALMLLLLLIAVPAQARQDSVQVRSLGFDGLRVIPDGLLATAIVSTQTRCITPALAPLCLFGIGLDRQYVDARILSADVVRLRLFYYQRGYREATVTLDTARSSDGMDVRFRINAGPPVVAATVEYAGTDSLPVTTAGLPLRLGAPLSMIDYELTRDTLTQRLANRGYARAYVLANYEIASDSPHIAHVRFEVAPGVRARFGEIQVDGAARVSPAVVRRMLTFKPGDSYSIDALLRSQRSLFSLEIFRHAQIDTIASTNDSIVPVRVQVNEGDLHRFRIGVGMNTAEYLNAEGRWTTRNFLGGARHLEVRGRLTNLVSGLKYLPVFDDCSGLYCDVSGSLSVDFEQPWFMGSRNTLGLGLFADRLTLPQVYVRTSRGGSVSLRRALGGGAAVQLVYRPELTRLQSDGDVIFCVNFVACEQSEIQQLRESHWLAPIGLSYALDKSNNLLDATRGLIFRADAEYAGSAIGSDFAYGRLLAELIHYREITTGVVLATRLRPGLAEAIGKDNATLGLHPQKRFFAGGSNSVRGFAQYRLGPKLLTVDAARTLNDSIDVTFTGCSAQAINAGTCNVGDLVRTQPDLLDVRPIGGAALLEANAELRFPLIGGRLRGAAFLDVGQVWKTVGVASLRDLAWSPGVGIRYVSPIGPVRVDIGYNTQGAEQITVVTTEVCARRTAEVCDAIQPDQVYERGSLANTKVLQPLGTVAWNPYRSFLSRLQLHFSIGQAF